MIKFSNNISSYGYVIILFLKPFYSDELSKVLLLNLESFDVEVFAGAVAVVECEVTVVEAIWNKKYSSLNNVFRASVKDKNLIIIYFIHN